MTHHIGSDEGRLSEAEREALIEAIQNGDEVEWVENLLAARAAAPDALREARAWDEGYDAGYTEGANAWSTIPSRRNPYRNALADPTDGATT